VIAVRPTLADEQPALLQMARDEPLFSPTEADTVAELLDDSFRHPDHNGYYFLSAIEGERLLGFACYGPTPLTERTFTVYWLCVAAAARGRGIGRRLMQQVEQAVRLAGGRLIVLDTSGRPAYAPTRAFYERIGYVRSATVPDFYAPGDDLAIYTFSLAPPAGSGSAEPAARRARVAG
jgi:GNAT superfamily N-acetyltransferase